MVTISGMKRLNGALGHGGIVMVFAASPLGFREGLSRANGLLGEARWGIDTSVQEVHQKAHDLVSHHLAHA